MRYRDAKAALRTLTTVAASQGGYFTARQAEVAGYDASHLSYHLHAGNFERVSRGLYRIPSLPLAEHDDLMRLSLWSRGRDDRPQAVVSHQTALALHDLAEFIPKEVHVTVPPMFRRHPAGNCVLHRAKLARDDARPFGSFSVTTPHRTLRDLADAKSLPDEQFMNAVSAAAERGLIRRKDVDQLLSTVRPRGRAPRRASRG